MEVGIIARPAHPYSDAERRIGWSQLRRFRLGDGSAAIERFVFTEFNLLWRATIPTGRRAMVDGVVVAEPAETQRVDGHDYFAPDAVNWELLSPSDPTSVCYWKGVASYYDVEVEGHRLPAAAWTYRDPSPAAQHIKDHIAFWRGVKVFSR